MLELFAFEKVEGGYCLTKYTGKENEREFVEIPESFLGEPVVALGKEAFYAAWFLKKIEIPSTITTMEDRCFFKCGKLKEISIPDSVTQLGSHIFADCESLEKVKLPRNITEIPEHFFGQCGKLSEVEMPEKVTVIQREAFFNCRSFHEFHVPTSVERIEEKAFQFCFCLHTLHLPSSLGTIGDKCFGSCVSLQNIFCHEGEVTCEKDTFLGCISIEKAPVSLLPYLEEKPRNQLGEEYFLEFSRLSLPHQKIVLDVAKESASLQQILFCLPSPEITAALLDHGICPTLSGLEHYLEMSIKQKSTQKNALFLNYKETHFSQEERETYQKRQESLDMGFEMHTLEELCEKWEFTEFRDGIWIKGYKRDGVSERIPGQFGEGERIVGLLRSDDHDFHPLEHIILESGIQILEEDCFKNHETLTSVVLPPTLQSVIENAFFGCTNLIEITFPSSVEHIDKFAFSGCTSLERAVFLGKMPDLSAFVFTGCKNLRFVGEEKGENRVDEFCI